MRALDVPARVVTGYQGADPLPVDGFYIVRQSSAHAWAEYWQAGVGWVRADPTAAVAPDRISRSRRLVPAPGLVAGALDAVNPALLAAAARCLGGASTTAGTSGCSTIRAASSSTCSRTSASTSPSWEDLAMLLVGALSTLALAGAAWAWWDRHRVDPWMRQREAPARALRDAGRAGAARTSAPRTPGARACAERHGAAGEAAGRAARHAAARSATAARRGATPTRR